MKLIALVRNQTGKKIELSGGLEAFRARKKILIGIKVEEKEFEPVEIKPGESKEFEGKTLSIEISQRANEEYSTEKKYELISADDLNDLFVLRKWKPGDRFIPLGMKSFKKSFRFFK